MARCSLNTFTQELRRRRVFSVVALYGAAAWVVIEVGGEVIDAGLITALTSRDLIILAIIGFPLTLIAGWFYDITKHGIVRTAPAAADEAFDGALRSKDYGLLVLLVAAWLVVYLAVPAPPATGQSFADKPTVVRPVAEKSIAILPFESRGDDPDDTHLAFGIHDDLMVHLGRVKDMILIAGSSISQIEPGTPDATVAAKLGVVFVMRGSVERVLDRIRVNVTLVEAAAGRQAWSNQFDREFSIANMFDIRKEIALSITDELQAVLTPEEKPRVFDDMPTSNMEAYALYMRGRRLYANRKGEDSRQALELFRQAVELDPEFALAWVGISDAANYLRGGRFIGFEEAREIMLPAVERALALDDQLGEAWMAQAIIYSNDEEWEQAKDACKKALKLSPGSAHVHHRCLNKIDLDAGWDPERQLANAYQIAQLDPLATVHQLNVAIALWVLGRFEEAERQFEFILLSDPDFSHTYRWYAFQLGDLGQLARAVQLTRRALELDPGYLWGQVNLFQNYVAMWEFEQAEALSERIVGHFDEFDEDEKEYWTVLVAMQLEFARGNWAEAIRQFDTLGSDGESLDEWHAWSQLVAGNMEKARESWYWWRPNQADPENTEDMIRGGLGCITAGLLIATGDEEQGHELLRQSRRWFEETLPQKIQDPDRYSDVWVCYLLEGSNEKALETSSARLRTGT